MANRQTVLKGLAAELRVLKPQEKNAYLHYLDGYVQKLAKGEEDVYFPERVACDMYFSLERTPYVQPEFFALITPQNIRARDKFQALCSGIIAYSRASDQERETFKKSLFQMANPIKKVLHLIKRYQRDME